MLHADKALALRASAAIRTSNRCMCDFLFQQVKGGKKDARTRVNKPLSILAHKEIKTRKCASQMVGSKAPARIWAMHASYS
jgi:hypothetical protein